MWLLRGIPVLRCRRLTLLARHIYLSQFLCLSKMTDRRRKAPEATSVFDKPLPPFSKGKSEVSLSTFAFLFSEVVQYNHGRVTSLTQLHEKLAELGHHVGFRMIDVLALKEKTPKREIKHVNMLWFIQKTLWKALFGKEADRLEQATANNTIYYLFEDEPLVNKFISVPKDQSSLNCAAFMAGIIEAFLNGTQFPCKVRAFLIKDKTTTAFEIKFEDSVLSRDKTLESLK